MNLPLDASVAARYYPYYRVGCSQAPIPLKEMGL